MRELWQALVRSGPAFRQHEAEAAEPQPAGGWLPRGTGYCVRVDWADGSHDFFGWTRSLKRAERLLDRDRRFWRHGPYRPSRHQVVILSEAAWRSHPSSAKCKAQECPP